MVDLHANDAFARTRMAEDAERAARQRLRRHVLSGGGRARAARSLAAVADRLAPSRSSRDPGYEVDRAA